MEPSSVGIAELDDRPEDVRMGSGACSVCGCQEYMAPANGNLCANCGHDYTLHS